MRKPTVIPVVMGIPQLPHPMAQARGSREEYLQGRNGQQSGWRKPDAPRLEMRLPSSAALLGWRG